MRYGAAARMYRERLVADLALSPLARAWARGAAPPDLPERCGLDRSALDDAAKLLNQVTPMVPGKRKTYYSFSLPAKLNHELRAVAEKLRWTRADVVRSLLHTVLQTDLEPTRRPFRKWVADSDEAETFRAQLAPEKPRRKRRTSPNGATVRPDREHISYLARPGLYGALKARAAAYGVTVSRYYALWLSDLVDGHLAHLVLPLVTCEQTFETAEEYVRPVLRFDPPPETP